MITIREALSSRRTLHLPVIVQFYSLFCPSPYHKTYNFILMILPSPQYLKRDDIQPQQQYNTTHQETWNFPTTNLRSAKDKHTVGSKVKQRKPESQ
jgi:hypothetical protein